MGCSRFKRRIEGIHFGLEPDPLSVRKEEEVARRCSVEHSDRRAVNAMLPKQPREQARSENGCMQVKRNVRVWAGGMWDVTCSWAKGVGEDLLVSLKKGHSWERATRYVVFTGIGYAFSMTRLPNVPQTFAPLIGIVLTLMMALCTPLVSSVGALVPGFFLGLFIVLAWVTAMLAAVTVDTFALGFMYIVCCLGICWLGTLRLGKYGRLTLIISAVNTYFGILLLFYMFPTVYEGEAFAVPTDPPNSTHFDPDMFPAAVRTMTGRFKEDFFIMTEEIQMVLDDHASGPPLEFPITVTKEIDTGPYDGAELYVQYVPGELTFGVEGGMFFVRGMWTWTDDDNPFALFRNFLSMFGIASALFVASLLTPPWRTSRSFVRENLSQMISSTIQPTADTGQALKGIGDKQPSIKQVNALHNSIGNFSSPHIMAVTTAFEPYAICPGLTVSTWLPLKDVMVASLNLATLAEELAAKNISCDLETELLHGSIRYRAGEFLNTSARFLESSSSVVTKEPLCRALWQDDMQADECLRSFSRDLEALQEKSADCRQKLLRLAQEQRVGQGLSSDNADELVFFCTLRYGQALFRFGRRMHRLLQAQRTHQASNILLNVFPFFWVPQIMIRRLLYSLRSVAWFWKWTKERWWKKKQVIWTLKFTLGLAALVAPTVFSPAFRKWELAGGGTMSGGYVQVRGQPPGRFSGWFPLGFITTFSITLEGSVHKGALRALGTCVGALSAWLALLFFESSIYGLIAWMCVTNFVAYLTTTNPTEPLLGTNPTYGYAVHLFSITQAIIVLSAYRGLGERDQLTLNRMVANICGILTSIIVSAIIPFKTNKTVHEILDSGLYLCTSLTETMLNKVTRIEASGEFESTLFKVRKLCMADTLESYAEELRRGRLLLEDASIFPQMHVLSVDQSLGPQLVRMALYHARLTRVHTFLFRLLSDINVEEKEVFAAKQLHEQLVSKLLFRKHPTSLAGNDKIALGDSSVQAAVLHFFQSPSFLQMVASFVQGCNICLGRVHIEYPPGEIRDSDGQPTLEEAAAELFRSSSACRDAALKIQYLRDVDGQKQSLANGLLVSKLMVFIHELEYCFHYLRGMVEDFYPPPEKNAERASM